MIGTLPLSLPQLEDRIVPELETVETRLLEVVSSADATINPPTSHLAAAGGKRRRGEGNHQRTTKEEYP